MQDLKIRRWGNSYNFNRLYCYLMFMFLPMFYVLFIYMYLNDPDIKEGMFWVIIALIILTPFYLFFFRFWMSMIKQKKYTAVKWFEVKSFENFAETISKVLKRNGYDFEIFKDVFRDGGYPKYKLRYLFKINNSNFDVGIFKTSVKDTLGINLIFSESTDINVIEKLKKDIDQGF